MLRDGAVETGMLPPKGADSELELTGSASRVIGSAYLVFGGYISGATTPFFLASSEPRRTTSVAGG